MVARQGFARLAGLSALAVAVCVPVAPAAADTATSTIVFTDTGEPLPLGQPVTFTASVAPEVEGGNVDFRMDGLVICAGVPAGGSPTTATCDITFPTSGSHTVQARYRGGFDSSASDSPTVTYMVGARRHRPPLWSARVDRRRAPGSR